MVVSLYINDTKAATGEDIKKKHQNPYTSKRGFELATYSINLYKISRKRI